MPAEDDGLLEGEDEDLAVRTVAEVAAYFLAHVGGEFSVDIGRELPEKLQAMGLSRPMA